MYHMTCLQLNIYLPLHSPSKHKLPLFPFSFSLFLFSTFSFCIQGAMAAHEESSDEYDSSSSSITALDSRRSCISDTSFGSSSNFSVKSFDSMASSSSLAGTHKPHKAHQAEWEAVGRARAASLGRIGLDNFRLIRRLGSGDLGNVYLCQLRDPRPSPSSPACLYAMKVVDREALAIRKKLQRAETEREILRTLDHPFLPTLYADFDASHYSCLVMEFCSGGDLHVARQRQPRWRFSVASAKFYAAETILALEYLHMMGVIYRDLKPENVLVRNDGHIMLSDFDLSLKCEVVPRLLREKSQLGTKNARGLSSSSYCMMPQMQPVLSCFYGGASKCTTKKVLPPPEGRGQQDEDEGEEDDAPNSSIKQTVELDPELVAEPSTVRSKSFVGTHEYLAPEVIAGAGHGSAVDWWTLGVFLYEMIYGRTPFKGENNEKTLINILKKPLSFPSMNIGSVKEFEEISKAQDLIRKLLMKNPKKRLGGLKGSVEVKKHEFFKGVNWALIRSVRPPEVPRDLRNNRIRVHKKLSKKEREEPFQIPQSFDYF